MEYFESAYKSIGQQGNAVSAMLVFLLSFGVFMLITNYSNLMSPPVSSQLVLDLKKDLHALGPWKLTPQSQKEPDTEILSKEQTLILAKVLWRFDLRVRSEVRKEAFKERRNLYSGQNWPYYEQTHDRLLEDLVKASKDLEMSAVTSVGLSRKNWLASLQAHFSFPNKYAPLRTLYKEVVEEYRNEIVPSHVESLSAESMGPAWRWLVLRDADTEDKMVQIIQKGDRSLYHRIKAYEAAKSEDQLHAEFSVDLGIFLHLEKHYKLRENEATISFNEELDKMLEAKDQSWLGTHARFSLWSKIERDYFVGPLFFDAYQSEEDAGEEKYRISISTLCRILELLDQVCTPRLRVLRQRLLESRREAFKASDWEKHGYLVQMLSFQELMVREEALSYVLFKLDIPFAAFQESFEYYVRHKGAATQYEFGLIARMQTKGREEDLKQTEEEMSGKLVSREQVLSIFEQLQKLEQQVKAEFDAEEKKESEGPEDLQYRQVVSEAQFFDQLALERNIEERAYFYSLQKMEIHNDPKFKAIQAKYSPSMQD